MNKAVPKDLETIVLKATAKEPEARYATAQELADDLKRYLEDKPIQAKRPTLVQRAAKWARRHRPAVCSAAVGLLIAAVVAAAIAWNVYQRRVELERVVGEHLAAARALLQSQDYLSADRQLAEARARLDVAQQQAGPLATAVARLSDEVSAKIRAQERFDQFQELRQRVHSSMYHNSPRELSRALENCQAALKLYGVLDQTLWQQQPEYQDLDAQQQKAVEEGAAELLFLSARMEIKNSWTPKARTAAHRVAIDALRRIESFHRPAPAVYLWIADSWQNLGEEKLAQHARKRAESLSSSTTALDYFVLGEFQHYRAQFEQSLESYSLALDRQPDHFLSLFGGGWTLNRLMRQEAAEAMLTGAIAVNPHSPFLYIRRGQSRQYQKGKLDLALADFSKAAELNPQDGTAYWCQGDALTQKGDLAQALAVYNKALELSPGGGGVPLSRGMLYARLGEHEKALSDFNVVIERVPGLAELNPQSEAFWEQLGYAHYHRALIYQTLDQRQRALNDFRDAVEAFTKAIEIQPLAGRYRRRRARCYTAIKDFDSALEDLAKLVEMHPVDPWDLKSLAWFYVAGPQDLRNPEKALPLAQKAVEAKPESHVYLNTLGVVYYRLRQLEQAAETLGKATQANEDGGTACDFFFLAMAHWQLDHKDEARQWYEKAVEWMEKNRPDNDELRRFRAEAEELLGLTDRPTPIEAQAAQKEESRRE